MVRNPLLLVVVSCLVVGLMVFSFTPDLSQFTAQYFLPKKMRQRTPEVAKFILVNGSVWRRHHGRTKDSRLRRSGPLHHQDLLTVERRSHLDIRFPSGDELRLEEKTKAIVEYWNPADSNSPVYVTLLIGDFRVLNKGKRGKLFIIQDRQLFSPGHRPNKPPFMLKLRSSELGLARVENEGMTPGMPPPAPDPDEEEGALTQSEGSTGLAETLTNKYIEEIVGLQKQNFQRCQANAIREMGKVQGQVLIGFTIQPRGKIEEAKILQTSIENKQLMDCLVSVFKNCRFQEFTGSPIVRSYPLSFE